MPGTIGRGPLAKLLLDLPLFEDLDYTQIGEVIDISTLQRPASGTVLCESRTIDENLLVLVEGSLRLESDTGRLIATLDAVRVIGEMGVFTGQVRSSCVIANDGACVLIIPAAGLQDLLEEDPQLAHHLMSSLVKLLYTRVHDVNEEMEHLRDVAQQLKNRLKELSPNDPLIAELFPE